MPIVVLPRERALAIAAVCGNNCSVQVAATNHINYRTPNQCCNECRQPLNAMCVRRTGRIALLLAVDRCRERNDAPSKTA
jgi:RecA-family ATPase